MTVNFLNSKTVLPLYVNKSFQSTRLLLQTVNNLHYNNSDIVIPKSYEPLDALQELPRSYCSKFFFNSEIRIQRDTFRAEF